MTAADGPGLQWEVREAHFRTLDTIRDVLDHTRRPLDVLKLDIENWEWKVLGSLLSSPSRAKVLNDVKQIALEVSCTGIWELSECCASSCVCLADSSMLWIGSYDQNCDIIWLPLTLQ